MKRFRTGPSEHIQTLVSSRQATSFFVLVADIYSSKIHLQNSFTMFYHLDQAVVNKNA